MKACTEGNKLIVEIDLSAPVRSKSGKTFIVATTHGFVKTEAVTAGKQISISLNAVTQ